MTPQGEGNNPMPDQDGGKPAHEKFAELKRAGSVWAIWLNGRPCFREAEEETGAVWVSMINTAHQAALTAERKRVLEMAHEMEQWVSHTLDKCSDENTGKSCPCGLSDFLSRLEGEGN